MKIVIDIPEEIYSFINTQWNDVPKINDSPINIICKAIVDSTPLTERPKGKWIDICVIKAFHYDGEPRVRCSRCGVKSFRDKSGEHSFKLTDQCFRSALFASFIRNDGNFYFCRFRN